MSEAFEFGPRGSLPQGDKLEHYRVEIKKLKKYNIEMEKAFTTKVQMLEKQIVQLKNKGGASQGTYQPGSNINNELTKRDKEINRLMEENQKLKRQNKYNPDRQLLNRRKEMFDSIADKDAEILRLKKNLHELESKYDGRFFNEPKIKHEYNMLLKENERMKRELEFHYDERKEKKREPVEVNSDLLDGIRYKKQYELVSKENQLLKNRIKMSQEDREKAIENNSNGQKVGKSTEIEILKKQLKQSEQRNQSLMEQLRRQELTSQKKEDPRSTNFKDITRMSIFNDPQRESRPEQNFSRISQQYDSNQNYESAYQRSSQKKPIFGHQHVSDSKYSRAREVEQPEDHEQNYSRVESYENKKRISKYENFQLGRI